MSRRRAGWGIAAAISAAALILSPLTPAVAAPVTVSSIDFEDGTIGDWTQSGGDGSTLTFVADPEGSGTVLRVNDRAADYVGIQSPTTIFETGETYTVSAKVRLAPGTPGSAGVRFVGKPGYGWIGNTTMTADAWTTVSGQWTAPAPEDGTPFQIYLGTAETGSPYSYLVDDVLITAEAPEPPADTVVLQSDFESGTAPWTGRGATIAQTDAAAHTGTHALAITNRTSSWNGASVDVSTLFEPGVTYTISAWVRLLDPAATPVGVNLGANQPGADNEYPWVGSRPTVGADWVQLTGTYVNDAAHPAASLYVEAAAAGVDLVLDDVLITAPADSPDEPEPGIVIDTDFEDATLQGWSIRQTGSGDPQLATTTDAAHTGDYSARVSNRTSQGQGPQYDVVGLLEPGVTYEVEAWVKFEGEPGDMTLSARTLSGTSESFTNLVQFTGLSQTEWVRVGGTFTIPAFDEAAELYFETRWVSEGAAGNTSPFLVDDIVVSIPEPAVIDTSLTPIMDTLDFPVGVAIDSRETAGSASDLLLHHFDQITAENHMKPEAWYDGTGTFGIHEQAATLMQFAKDEGLGMYGHVLVWHSQTPAWFFQNAAGEPLTTSEADKQFLRERLRTHIFAVAESLSAYGPYGGGNPLVAFDVVNEVVSDSGENPDGLRRSEWFRILGEEFIDLAFRYADEAFNEVYAAPGAERPVTLFINDYNTEQDGKQQRYLDLVERLLARGVPVDGVGHQFHVNLAMPVTALETAIKRFQHLPVVQAVTEFDVPTGTPVTAALLIEQGYYYRDAFRIFREYAADMFSVTVWGLTDGRSWRDSSGDPLVFDDGFQAKPAYFGTVGGDLAARLRTANVFAGDVALGPDATSSPEWQRLPQHAVESTARFQLRWAPEHLTAFVSVDDATTDATDAVAFEVDGAVVTVPRSGAAGPVVTEREGGYDVVAHLPITPAQGDAVAFDVRVTDAATTVGWNTPGAVGTLTLVEPLSFLEVVEAPDAPAIDGAIDGLWSQANAVTTGKQVEGTSGASATVRTLWMENTLYVLAQVADPTVDVSGSDPWIQDSVELYVDAGNYKNGSYRYDDSQIRISAENQVSFGTGDEAFQRARVQSETTPVEGGYIVEAAISLLEYGGAGSFHGLDFQVNDATAGARTSIRNWADPTGAGYQSTARWGVGELVEAAVPTDVVNTVAPSIAGTPVVGETLRADAGTWEPAGATFMYRWQADGDDIPGAKKSTYKIKPRDAGASITVVVTASAPGLADGSAVSASVVAEPAPKRVPPGHAR
ncbi:endo-1,4-beta-xylanase [Microbacterium sp. 2FI]|uniref:endo-1,4-beta-xylanase n=1 Tax=Microbacterium sp. 2FI TaxID=2502193 RepID=UPI001485668F|nr:endo-1,4-beta-xylanase [Microbacterium sp. 2FI]